mmetsp:Transcript_53870/g.153474  ORF Transcript_53870/g.153474 Transcript_53870/m.153474 type:complete len:221 (+) Transcript_53870:780-1442(+)
MDEAAHVNTTRRPAAAGERDLLLELECTGARAPRLWRLRQPGVPRGGRTDLVAPRWQARRRFRGQRAGGRLGQRVRKLLRPRRRGVSERQQARRLHAPPLVARRAGPGEPPLFRQRQPRGRWRRARRRLARSPGGGYGEVGAAGGCIPPAPGCAPVAWVLRHAVPGLVCHVGICFPAPGAAATAAGAFVGISFVLTADVGVLRTVLGIGWHVLLKSSRRD